MFFGKPIVYLYTTNNYVRAYDFIFSKRLSHRLSRHLIFWIVFLIYFYSVNFLPAKPEDLSDSETYLTAFQLMIYIPVSFISVYTAIYFLLPRYILTEKYLSLFLIITGLTIFYFSLAWLIMLLLAGITTNLSFNQLPVSIKWFQPIRYGIGLPLTSAVFVIVIQLLKHWHLEQKENELLQRQKINTELQLLKAQFQPNFLYDALQHIFYMLCKHSPQSPETVLKLSDLLSYILYENEKDEAPLQKEIEIIKTYLSLKKTFYPDRLSIQLKQQGETRGINIPPLLLVSLVESCLEKFLQISTQQLDLTLDIKSEHGELYFMLECKTNFENEAAESNDNKWIKPLKRMEMLYAGKHSFDVYSENGTTNLLLVLETGEALPFIDQEKEEFALL
jgi:sensor histidine kinase YesM